MAKKKVKLNKNESENLLPIIREFNKIAGALNGLLSRRVDSKEKKISVLVSRIKRPDAKSSRISVQSVEFTRSFLNRQRKKTKKVKNQSEWDDNFSQKRGTII